MAKNKFHRSQMAHRRLNKFWQSKGNTDKNRAYGNYHADCYDKQQEKGRMLSKKEKRSLFFWWFNYEVNDIKGKYPL